MLSSNHLWLLIGIALGVWVVPMVMGLVKSKGKLGNA